MPISMLTLGFFQRNRSSRILSRRAALQLHVSSTPKAARIARPKHLIPSNALFGSNPQKALAWEPSHSQPTTQSPSPPSVLQIPTLFPSPFLHPLPSRTQASIPNTMSNVPPPQSLGFPPFFFPPPLSPKIVAPPTPSRPPRGAPPPPKTPPPAPPLPPRRTPPPPSPPVLAPPPPRKMAPPPPMPPSPAPKPPPRPPVIPPAPPTPPSPIPKPPPRPLPPPISPPPPPPVTPPSPPSPIPQNTVIIIVFASLGSLLFVAFVAAALCCFLKKKKKKTAQETEVVNVEDNVHVHETIIPGPYGQQVVAMAVDEDIKVQGVIKKNELVGEASGTKLGVQTPQTSDGDAGVPTGSKHHHLLEHKG